MNEKLEGNKKTEYVVSLVYRLPKKNHDAIVEFSKKYVDMLAKYGVLRYDVIQLVKADKKYQNLSISTKSCQQI
jgi:hypothetical protein